MIVTIQLILLKGHGQLTWIVPVLSIAARPSHSRMRLRYIGWENNHFNNLQLNFMCLKTVNI